MRKFALFAIFGSVFISGCCNLEIATTREFRSKEVMSTDGKPLAHVLCTNYGWFLFNRLPIVCGNGKDKDGFPFVFFRNDVTLDVVHGKLVDEARIYKTELADLHVTYTDDVLFTIPGLSIPIPIPYVICYKEVQTSAVMVEPYRGDAALKRKEQRVLKQMNDLLDDGK